MELLSYHNFKPTPRQAEFFKAKAKYKLFGGSMGCVSGDTIIKINRGGCSREYTIKDLFEKTNILKTLSTEIPTYARSYKDGNIGLNLVKNIFYSGIKNTYTLTLENGFTINATSDHRIMTKQGWKELVFLNSKDEVMIDVIKKHKTKKEKKKQVKKLYKNIGVGKYCPYARVWKSGKKTSYLAEKHKITYDAFENNLTVEEFIKQTHYENNLSFTNYLTHIIHHIDNNHLNNNLSNLAKLTKKDHLKLHGNYNSFGHGIPEYSKVKSVKFNKTEDTYDIEMSSPYNNFVANNIVIHNCGKTLTLCAGVIHKAITIPNNRILFARHEYKSFKQSTMVDFDMLLPPEFIKKRNETAGEIEFINGSIIILSGLENQEKIKTLNLGGFAIDEITQTKRDIFNMLTTRLRLGHLKEEDYFGWGASNPEPGWVKDMFVDPTINGTIDKDFAFIQALPQDNPHLPKTYISNLRKTLPPLWITKYLEGSWDVFDNQIFKPDYIIKSKPLPTKFEEIFIAVDPAITEREDEKVDETAIAVMGVDENNIIHEIETRHGRWSVQTTIQNCIEVNKIYKPSFFGVEVIAYQEALRQLLVEAGVDAIPIKRDGDKIRRAYAVSTLFEQNRVRLNTDALIKQTLEFPEASKHGGHDDLIDAVILCLTMYKKFSTEIKPRIKKTTDELTIMEKNFWDTYRKEINNQGESDIITYLYGE